jgi:hypothetical protein
LICCFDMSTQLVCLLQRFARWKSSDYFKC